MTNCFALGGRTGHAGLFGTVDGVLDFARGLLDGSGATPAMLDAIRTPVEGHRTCGWEIRFPAGRAEQACSPGTIGHTGFTGTGLWIDFERGLALLDAADQSRPPDAHADSGIFALRPATGDAVIAASVEGRWRRRQLRVRRRPQRIDDGHAAHDKSVLHVLRKSRLHPASAAAVTISASHNCSL
ncbi:hypothetical protein AB5I41_26050 [Sphingomonas sp. MMS24-JH45]